MNSDHKAINKEQLHCSFCGKPADMVEALIAGPGINICGQCVLICNAILANHDKSKTAERSE